MIKINSEILKKQPNFWNNCLFHPTDAVEDAWGKRILDTMASDGAINTVRIYAMLEDIVYLDEYDNIQYDFRASDLRLDYLLSRGYDILIAYAGMPDCIAVTTDFKSCESKNSTRYKGKLFNTSVPKDFSVWEEICYQYTKHNVERYGEDVVAKWHCQCFNEPDVPGFFLRNLPVDAESTKIRCREYCKLYDAFARGVARACDKMHIGGPAIANEMDFFDDFLAHVKENNIRMDYVSFHNYGTSPMKILNEGERISVSNSIRNHLEFMRIIEKHGFADKELICDEWGASSHGFYNVEECPAFWFRENEVYSAYYVKLVNKLIKMNTKLSKMMICLSGQHEMVTDFSGFRNFFTLNFIRKPIYNAYVLASKLGENIVSVEKANDNLFVIPTKCDNGDYSVLLSYSSEYFEENIGDVEETVEFSEDISGKTVTVWCIDKDTTNPYRLCQKMGIERPEGEQIAFLREEGRLKPVLTQSADKALTLKFKPNSVYLVTVTR